MKYKTNFYKEKTQPVTSVGIIAIKLEDIDDTVQSKIKSTLKININDHTNILINKPNDLEYFSYLKNKIKFVMIARKHSVGFIEFIRGKYRENNNQELIFLFRQMSMHEIEIIKNAKDFDDLWSHLWSTNKYKTKYLSEYNQSKYKFNSLKEGKFMFLDLNFYVNHVKPDWIYPEWGFPKGRPNSSKELLLNCAKREFQEETGLTDSDYDVLEHVGPFEEHFIGTNGIQYKHIYYVALIKNNVELKLSPENHHQKYEIGDIQFYSIEDGLKVIRPYHKHRVQILIRLHVSLINQLILSLNS
jgi:8-oxo-dGTP pyrophosphatase MutT (NUDIX family)